MDTTINGKRVTLRDKIPAKMGWNIIIARDGILQKSWEDLTFDDVASLAVLAVDSWELPGDPHEAVSFSELDLVDEFVPLANELVKWLNSRLAAPKN
jgi:hypothetical protein